tara:strand:- start:227 stop:727 length:501 start_codon:yes stop_codon:yes gene_type:complete
MTKVDEVKNEKNGLDKDAIMKVIPYNEHFLMIDEVKSIEKDSLVATKFADPEADFFKGHFADFPIMPGALIVEGMGQAATILIRSNIDNHEEKDVLAYKITEAKFSSPTLPGDTLTYELRLLGKDDRGALVTAIAKVDGKQVAEARMMLAVVDKKEFRENATKGNK